MDYVAQYYKKLGELFSVIAREENDSITAAGNYIGDWLGQDETNLLYVIGTGEHSTMAANEIFKRAGGFPQTSPIFSCAMYFERIPGMITKDLGRYEFKKGAPVIIASHVGMNAYTIEAALEFKKKGLYLIGIEATGICAALPMDFPGRAPSKQSLREICDITIDHKTPFGDTVIEIEGVKSKAAPVSNMLIFSIMHLLEIAAVERMAQKGFKPQIFISGNIPGGDEHNADFNEKYRALVKHW